MDRWTQIELFVKTVDLGSISAAGEALGLSAPVASRHLSTLEHRLGTRLIERTTRRQWLTEAGSRYYRRCVGILAEVSEAEIEAADAATRPRGMLRVTSSVSFAMMHIAPLLPEFRHRYPELAVEIVTANRYPDFIDAGIDIAIRTREQEADSGITVRKLARTRRVLTASHGYLGTHGTPTAPSELGAHQLLVYNLARDPFVLHLKRDGESMDLPITGAIHSNEGQVLCAAARAGAGILIQPIYIVHDDIVAGRLVPVLTDWELPSLTVNLAYQTRKHQPAKIRVFNDFLTEHFQRLDLERRWLV